MVILSCTKINLLTRHLNIAPYIHAPEHVHTCTVTVYMYLYSIDVWSLWVEVEREAVRDLPIRHPGSKPVGRDQLVWVIWSQHTTNSLDSMNILIVLRRNGTWKAVLSYNVMYDTKSENKCNCGRSSKPLMQSLAPPKLELYPAHTLLLAYVHVFAVINFGHMLLMTFTCTRDASCAHEQKATAY